MLYKFSIQSLNAKDNRQAAVVNYLPNPDELALDTVENLEAGLDNTRAIIAELKK